MTTPTAPSQSTLMRLLPQGDLQKGGSRVGWSFLRSFKECPMKWYNTYLRPHRRVPGAYGHTFPSRYNARELGTLCHHVLQLWYLSDCDIEPCSPTPADCTLPHAHGRCLKAPHEHRGEYDLNAALASLPEFVVTHYPHWDNETCAEAIGDCTSLMERHVAYCGPGGTVPEFRTWQVAHDGANIPLIERTFELPLGYADYIFTSKADVVMQGYGKLYPFDHKTHDAGVVSKKLRAYSVDGQITGQVWVLRALWDTDPTTGLLKPPAEWLTGDGGCVNIIVKRAAASKPPRMLEIMGRTPLDLEMFRTSTVRTLKRMNELVEEWQGHVSAGMDPDAASLVTFDSFPSGDMCGEWPCDFYDGCKTREMLGDWLTDQTEPRWVPAQGATS